jgi:tRNA (adenine37-N6)-methyltransferase
MDDETVSTLTIRPIGWLETPWKTTSECPRNGRQLVPPPLCHAVLHPEFAEGLRDIEGFSHLILLYWLHRGSGPAMIVTPRRDGRPHGLFATRSPRRPNPIAMSVVAFEGLDGTGRLRVRNLDCLDGTPLVDIKPYIVRTDAEPGASLGWLADTPR